MDIFTEVIKTANNPNFAMPTTMVQEDTDEKLTYTYHYEGEVVATLCVIKGCGVRWDIKSDEFHSAIIEEHNSSDFCQKYPDSKVENPYK